MRRFVMRTHAINTMHAALRAPMHMVPMYHACSAVSLRAAVARSAAAQALHVRGDSYCWCAVTHTVIHAAASGLLCCRQQQARAPLPCCAQPAVTPPARSHPCAHPDLHLSLHPSPIGTSIQAAQHAPLHNHPILRPTLSLSSPPAGVQLRRRQDRLLPCQVHHGGCGRPDGQPAGPGLRPGGGGGQA